MGEDWEVEQCAARRIENLKILEAVNVEIRRVINSFWVCLIDVVVVY